MKPFLITLVFLALLFTACSPESTIAESWTEQTTLGAFPKLVTVESDIFDYADLENAAYAHSVDFEDGQGGRSVKNYLVYLAYRDSTTVGTSEPMLLRTINRNEFILRPESGLLGLDLVIPFTEVAALLGIDDFSSLSIDERFDFRTEIETEDDRVFSALNSTPAITNAFQGIWDFRVPFACPFSDDMFVGEYQISYGYAYDPPLSLGQRPFGQDLNRTVLLEQTDNPQVRRLNYGSYLVQASFLTNDVSLTFSCGNLQQSDLRTNVGCGVTEVLGATQNGTATYDPNDDSTFTIEMIDLPPQLNGNCFPATFGTSLRYSIVFTKI